MIPLRWAEGDRCAVRRDGEVLLGTVEGLGDGCASVRINEWRMVFCGLEELELVPFIRTTQAEPAYPSDAAPSQGKAAGRSGNANYSDFISQKLTRSPSTGLALVPELHPSLFPFQVDLVSWALRSGRAALFADTGLGKTAMQLEWARQVAEATSGLVLILAPLAVAAQTVREGERLGMRVRHVRSGADIGSEIGVYITNYDRLHRFDASLSSGVVLDESSIIKHHDAKTLAGLLEAFRDTPFKLAATATPSPNDYTELGTHAEFLGVCTRVEMLSEYFVHDGSSTQDWRLKGHARAHFWRWVATWAALIRKPSDLGCSDKGYNLPPLNVTQHTIAASLEVENAKKVGQTSLFVEPAKTLTERRAARRGSLSERVARTVALVTMGCERCQRQEKSNSPTTENTIDKTSTVGSNALLSSRTCTTPSVENNTPSTSRSGRKRGSRRASGKSATPASDTRSGSESSESSLGSTEASLKSRTDDALSADAKRTSTESNDDSTSITVIVPGKSEGSFAPHATSDLASSATILTDSRWPRGTCGCNATERWVIWCELNDEQDELASLLGADCVSIQGSDEPLMKEQRLLAFLGGDHRILLTKPSIAGWGINMQSCCRMAFVGVKDSWESYYQAIRREWRFGQKRPVEVHVFASELEGAVVENLRRKEADALRMAEELGAETREAVRAEVHGSKRDTNDYSPIVKMTVPAWLRGSAA